jgi:signal transduction histidine kinase
MMSLHPFRIWPRRLRWRLVLSFALTVALLQTVLTGAERLLVQRALVNSIASSLESTVRAGFAGGISVQGSTPLIISQEGAASAFKQGTALLQAAQQGVVAGDMQAIKQSLAEMQQATTIFESMAAYTGKSSSAAQGLAYLQEAQKDLASWGATPVEVKQIALLMQEAQNAFSQAWNQQIAARQQDTASISALKRAAEVTNHLGELTTALALPDQPVAMLDARGDVLARASTLAGDRKRAQPLAPAVLQSLLATAIPRVEKITSPWTAQVSTPDGPYLLLLWPADEPVVTPTSGGLLARLKANPKAAADPALPMILKNPQYETSGLTVLIAQRLSDTQQVVRTVTMLSIAGAAVVIALAALLSLIAVGRALRPLAAITHGAERLALGDYRYRLALEAADDEVGRLAAAFDRMAAAIASAFATQRRFVADASHELRTPLTALRGYTDVLLLGVGEDRATGERVLRAMQEDLGRMSRLVEDLLTLARLDGGMLLHTAPIAVADLLDAAAYEGRTIAQGRQQIVAEPVPPDLLVWADRDRLRQVLSNIVGNACAYCPPGSTMHIRAWQHQQDVVIQVQDDGPGIAPADLARLGERFYRGDAARSRRTGGTGLGLAIAQTIVEAHGGALTIASELGSGTIVTIHLPAVPNIL